MRIKNLFEIALLSICIVLVSCGKDEPEPTPPSNGDSTNNTPTAWGVLIDIPQVDGNEDFAGNLQTTNKGVYMEVDLNNGESQWIYRMNTGSQTWLKCENVESYYCWEPRNYYYDVDDRFSYFYSGSATSGLIGINTGSPFQLSTPHNFSDGFNANTQMLMDNSSINDTWRLTWNGVQVKQPNELNLYNTIFTFPQVDPFYRAVADPSENCIWLTTNASSIIYKLYSTGDVTTWDVAALTGRPGYVGKIEFSVLPGHTDVYFDYGSSYMRIDERTTLETFYIEPDGLQFAFTVDNNFLYSTDGKKINLSSGAVGTFIPPSPGFDDIALYNDYFNKTYSLMTSTQIEVLKNDGDPYIYSIYDNKLFRIPKSL